MSTTAPTQLLVAGYTCRVCRQTLTLKDSMIVGEKPEDRTDRVLEMLVTHLGEKHKEQLATVFIAAEQFKGWLTVQQFPNNDNTLSAQAEGIRLQFRKISKRVHITDELIEKQVGAFLSTPEYETNPKAAITKLLKGFRDSLDEVLGPTSQAVR